MTAQGPELIAAIKHSHPGYQVALEPPGIARSIAMGALAMLPWTLYEVCADVSATGPVNAAAASCCALAVGGVLGIATAWCRSRALLSLACMTSVVLGGAHVLWWALARGLAVSPPLRDVEVWLVASLPALGHFVLWPKAFAPRFPLRGSLRLLLRASLTLAVFAVALNIVELAAPRIVPAVAIGLVLSAALWSAPRLHSPTLPLSAALIAYVGLWHLDPSYGGLRLLCTAAVLSMALLAVRLSWPPALGAHQGRRADWIVVGLWLASWWGFEHLLRLHPAVYRASMTGRGISSSLIGALQSASDIDRDGFGVMFGQADCEPTQPSVHPGAHEIADNGHDDNCTGGDAASLRGDFVRAEMALNAPPRARVGDAVVVVVDTFRPDVVATEMPFLRDFEAHARTFARAYATSSFTVQSLAGLFSAQLPSALHYRWHSSSDGEVLDLPETIFGSLRKLGFDTGAVVLGGPSILPFVREVDVVRSELMDTPAAQTTDLALAAWEDLRARDAERRLLYVHYLALHGAPGDPARYRRLASELDGELERLWRAIGSEPLWMVTGDHGEAFAEHGVIGHSTTLFIEAVRVPLLVRHRSISAGEERAVTSLLGLSPTLLALLSPRSAQNRGPYLCLGQVPCGDVPAPMALEKPRSHVHALVLGDTHLIHELYSDRLELYDLARDPSERMPRLPPRQALAAFQAWQEHGFVAGARPRWLVVPTRAVGPVLGVLPD